MRMPIDPLPKIKTGGRPTKWHDDIPVLYKDLLLEGYKHHEILRGWGIRPAQFDSWRKKSDELEDIYLSLAKMPDVKEQFSKEGMQKLANELLHDLMARMKAQPQAYKPNEIITACKEALDRTEGKPVQSTIIDQNTTYTIVSAIPAAPNSLPAKQEQNILPAQQEHNHFPAKQDIESNYEVIDNEKNQGGGTPL